MACITTMQRYEIKYLLGAREKEAVLQAMSPYMELDEYGRTTIRNVYFDTDSFRLIRRSLEKPAYKEKLRIRSYQPACPDDPVFVELKRNTSRWSTNGGWCCPNRKPSRAFGRTPLCRFSPRSPMRSNTSGAIIRPCGPLPSSPMNGRPSA